jgi:AcrR family transcriptional regulator
MTTFQASKIERMTPRTVATRAKLVAVAERLFAERGVEGVSLNEINKLAGQRNSNACQYHFGNKTGLLQAIIDKHVPGIAARRNEMLDRLETSGQITLRGAIKALVYPVAEKLFDPNGGKEFIGVNAQLVVPHTLSHWELTSAPFTVPSLQRWTRALHTAMAEHVLPPPVLEQRMLLAAMLLFHGLADHSRMLEAIGQIGTSIDTELFVNNLEDSIVALLSAPLSSDTQQRLQTMADAGKSPGQL